MNLPRKIQLEVGKICVDHGFNVLSGAFNIVPQVISSEEMIRYFKGMFPAIRTSMKDPSCYLTDIEPWNDFINLFWLKELKSMIDKMDCEDFTDIFAAFAKLVLKISVFKIYGGISDKNTGKWIGYHYWFAIVSQEKEGKRLYFYEPQKRILIQYLGQKIVMDEWIYSPEQVICS